MFRSNGEHEDKQNPRLQSWYKSTACLTQAGKKHLKTQLWTGLVENKQWATSISRHPIQEVHPAFLGAEMEFGCQRTKRAM